MTTTLATGAPAVAPDPRAPFRPWDEAPVLAALVAIVVAVLSIGTLAGPRWPGDSSAEAGFARDMSDHHGQGVQLAELARARTADEEVAALATDIALTQQAQIGQMSGWLAAWGLSPTRSDEPMAWMGHPSPAPMPGMATPAEVAALATGPADEVDVTFLRLMIRHHRGGVLMARGALARASRPEALALARAMAEAQAAEVRAMEIMLVERGASPVTEAVTMPPMAGDGHDHGHSLGALAQSVLGTLPLAAGALGAAWLGIDGVRRRRAWAGLLRPIPAVAGEFRWAAAVGLAGAGLIHLALAPEHFEEGRFFGVFFVTSALAQLALAGALMAWPAPRVLGGAGALSLALVAVYFLFRLLPPPGVESVETLDAVGLFTQSLQLATAAACAAAWGLGWPRPRRLVVP